LVACKCTQCGATLSFKCTQCGASWAAKLGPGQYSLHSSKCPWSEPAPYPY
jgi:hypothetical protein